MTEEVSRIPGMSNDPRVLVFRRSFTPPEKEDALEVDAYVVITDRYVVICDTLICPEDMEMVINQIHPMLTERELLVVNSHADWDHIWGNCYFRDEWNRPIIAHAHSLKRTHSARAKEVLDDYQSRYTTFRNVELIPPTLTFDQMLTIHGGNLTLELFPAPGHQPDHIAVWLPELRLLLAFDAVENPIPTLYEPDGVPLMFATLEHFLTLQPARVLCSHGGTTETIQIEKNLRYLREVEQRVRSLLTTSQPTTAGALLDTALREYPFEQVLVSMPPHNADEDMTFYRLAHATNVRCMIEWLMSQS